MSYKIIKYLKPETVFLTEEDSGEKLVIKVCASSPMIAKFSEFVHQKGGLLAELVPEFSLKDDYLCQKFLNWAIAGDTVKTYGIRNEAFKIIDPEKLGTAFVELQKLSFSDPQLTVRGAGFYLENINEFKPSLIREYGEDFANKVEVFLISNSDIINQYSTFLANGDVHPQNLMYHNNKFMIIDWDLLHIDSPTWDLSDIYVWGWRNSEWQNRLVAAYKKVMPLSIIDFEKVFAFDVVYLSSQLIKHGLIIKAPTEFLDAQKKILTTFLGH
ncbi:MAG: phosphotransferase [Candidatus Gottesmanbacteria bacterium]